MFSDWIMQWNDIEKDVQINLRWAYKLAFEKLPIETFIKQHHGLELKTWSEAKYINRDIHFKNELIKNLPVDARINFLVAILEINKRKLATILDIAESSAGNILKINKESNHGHEITAKLAIVLDVDEYYLTGRNNIYLVNSSFTEYEKEAKILFLRDLPNILNDRKEKIIGLILVDDFSIISRRIYTRLVIKNDFFLIEFYLQFEEELDIEKIKEAIKYQIQYVIHTHATLRTTRKVVLVGTYKELSEDLNRYIQELKKQKYTSIFQI